MPNPKSLKNLKPLGSNSLTPEEQHAIRSKGGVVAAQKRSERKALREFVADAMAQKPQLTPKKIKDLEKMGFTADNIDLWTLCLAGLINATASGDARAGQVLLEYAGSDAATVNTSERLKLERERLAFAREQAEYERQQKQQARDDTGQLDKLIAGLEELRK